MPSVAMAAEMHSRQETRRDLVDDSAVVDFCDGDAAIRPLSRRIDLAVEVDDDSAGDVDACD